MSDIINLLVGGERVDSLRLARLQAKDNAQASFAALLEPADPGTFPLAERYAIAAVVAGWHGQERPAEFYRDLLNDEVEEPKLGEAIDHFVATARTAGPYQQGGFALADATSFGPRLAAGLDFAHLLIFHPKDASPEAIGHLQSAGWSATDIVTLAQLVAFLAFQLRVVQGLRVMVGGNTEDAASASEVASASAAPRDVDRRPVWQVHADTLQPEVALPTHFVNHSLGWKPWVVPLEKSELTEMELDALIQPERAGSEYFRLLARDAAALKARTLTDLDIFFNTEGGLGRAERELVATLVSRFNGCEYCASVHQQRSKEEGGDAEIIDRLLDEGVDADLESPLWNALRDAAVVLTATPVRFAEQHVADLRAVGLEERAIVDAIYSAAFFNWANRLMLTLGTADVPRRFREN